VVQKNYFGNKNPQLIPEGWEISSSTPEKLRVRERECVPCLFKLFAYLFICAYIIGPSPSPLPLLLLSMNLG
jgi:hypothetical protein